MTVSDAPTLRSDAGADGGGWIRRDHVIDLAAVVGVVFSMIVVVKVTTRTTHVLGVVLLAVVVSYLTFPVRTVIERHAGRGVAAGLVPFLTFAVAAGVAVAVTRDITSQAERVAAMLSDAVGDFRAGSLPARIAKSLDAQTNIRNALSRTGTTLVAGQGTAAGFGSSVADLFVVIVVGAFLQGKGRAGVDRVIALWPRPRRRAVRERWTTVETRAGAMFRGSVVLSLATGVLVATALWAMGIPGGLALGAWAGLWAPVQVVGPAIACSPLLLVLLVQRDAPRPVAVLVVVGVAAAVVIGRRRLARRADIHPGPATWVLAYAIGYAGAGTPGLVLAYAAVAFVSAWSATPAPDSSAEHAASDAANRTPLFVAATRDEWWRTVLTWRGLAVITATVAVATLAWTVIGALSVFVLWLSLALLLGIGFDRPVAILLRRIPRISRSVAAAFVLSVFLGVVVGGVVLAEQGGARNDASLSNELPRAVRRFEHAPLIGTTLRERDAANWVKKEIEGLPGLLRSTKTGNVLPSLGARIGDLFWVVTLAVTLLIDGPRLVAEARRLLPVRYRRQFGTFVSVAHQAIGGYLAGSSVIAALDALFVLVMAISLKVPLAPALAGWAFLTNFVPQIGGLLGGAPLVLLAFTVGPVQAVVAGVGFVLYQFFENHLLGPAIISKAVDISALASLLAALVGAAAAGPVGALLLTPLVGVVKVAVDMTRRGEVPGAQVMVSPSASSP